MNQVLHGMEVRFNILFRKKVERQICTKSMAWLKIVWFGLVWFGLFKNCLVWLKIVWFG